jgi:hypothetical protein
VITPDEVESKDQLFILTGFIFFKRDPPCFLLPETSGIVRIPADKRGIVSGRSG